MKPPTGSEESLLSAGPEIVLFIAGGILTVFVVAFVTWLLVHAIREERDARAAEAGSKEDS